MKKICLIIAIICLSSSLFSPVTVQAQAAGEGLTISPPITELQFDPGKTYEEIIKINNPTKDLVTVYPAARNFSSSGETGMPAIENPGQDATYGLATWISFSQTKLALTPEQEIEFKYTINVPSDAEPGGHYASVLFASQPPKPDEKETQIALASMVGSLILGKVSGNIVEQGKIAEFSSNGHFFLKPPVNFTLRIENNGNVHFAPQGQIAISNWGKKLQSQNINPQKGNILPNSIRRFDNLKYDGKWYSFGKFDVALAASYGTTNQPLLGSLSFWIIPWWFITIVVLAIVTIIYFIVKKRKKKRNHPKSVLPQEPPQKKRVILQ